jgi:hypothetical protein
VMLSVAAAASGVADTITLVCAASSGVDGPLGLICAGGAETISYAAGFVSAAADVADQFYTGKFSYGNLLVDAVTIVTAGAGQFAKTWLEKEFANGPREVQELYAVLRSGGQAAATLFLDTYGFFSSILSWF